MRYTLGSNEKLKSKLLIGQLFAEGKHVKSFPIRLIYLKQKHQSAFPIQVGFSVPKRNIKLAVNRIRIKRLMREVYRKHKHEYANNLNKQYIFMFVFMAKEEIKYNDLELIMKKVCTKFLKKVNENEKN